MDEQEDLVRELIHRSDGPMTLPPFPLAVMRQKRSRRAATFAAVAAAVLTVVVGGAIIGGQRNQPPASDSAGSAAPQLSSSFGFVVNMGGISTGLRSETDTTPFAVIPGRWPQAVSPDGRRLAYWTTAPDGEIPHVLHVYDIPHRSDRVVLNLATQRGGDGGFLTFSADSQMLLFAVTDTRATYVGPRGPVIPEYSALDVVDLQSGTPTPRELFRVSGRWLRPLGWDRASGVITAIDELAQDSLGVRPAARIYVYDDRSSALRVVTPSVPLDAPSAVAAPTAAAFAAATATHDAIVEWSAGQPDAQRRSASQSTGRVGQVAFMNDGTTLVVGVTHRIERWSTDGSRATLVNDANAPFFLRADRNVIVVPNGNPNDPRLRLIDVATGQATEVAVRDVPVDSVRTVVP